MKTKTGILAILLAASLTTSQAQDDWTRKAAFGGGRRITAVGFSIGSKGYIGTGDDNCCALFKDFWEYDPATNTWTQKADFGGTPRSLAVGFSIGSKGYIGTGLDSASAMRKDFWEYDPAANTWTQKADFGGTPRFIASGFSIGSKGYIGTGYDGGGDTKDFWEYDPSSDVWTQKADFGGVARESAVGFSVGSKGYIGTGYIYLVGLTSDFWEYDPSTDGWTEKADFGGVARQAAVGFSIGAKGYIGTGQADIRKNDFWEYDPSSNAWAQKADFGGTARELATGFSIGGKGYLGTGIDDSYRIAVKDFWEYIPDRSSEECLPAPAGLVSWWSGDKTADDVQGTNPGVLKHGASFTRGMIGPAFLFDGIDDIVEIRNSPTLSQTRITLDAWVYPTGKQGAHRHIISKDNETTGAREYILSLEDLNQFAAFVGLPAGPKQIGSKTIAQLNTWYHVAMTHDGTTLRLYVNGSLENTLDAVGDMPPTSNPVGIGGNIEPVFFEGIIDEVQIFDRALSDAEIFVMYQAGTEGQCKPDIFVASINPSYTVSGHGFRISTAIVIQDVNGIGISDASVQLGVILPNGSALTFPLKTDTAGQASVSFTVADTGLYKFKVRNVNHPIREYDASLNIETSDTLVIP